MWQVMVGQNASGNKYLPWMRLNKTIKAHESTNFKKYWLRLHLLRDFMELKTINHVASAACDGNARSSQSIPCLSRFLRMIRIVASGNWLLIMISISFLNLEKLSRKMSFRAARVFVVPSGHSTDLKKIGFHFKLMDYIHPTWDDTVSQTLKSRRNDCECEYLRFHHHFNLLSKILRAC